VDLLPVKPDALEDEIKFMLVIAATSMQKVRKS
jgi:hypothetical protein